MYPFSDPSDACWATKFFPDRFAMFIDVNIIMNIMKSVTAVSGMLRVIMLKRTLTIVIRLVRNCGRAWLIICLRVSMSFV